MAGDTSWVKRWKLYLKDELEDFRLDPQHMLKCYNFWLAEKLKGAIVEEQEEVALLVAAKLRELGYLDE